VPDTTTLGLVSIGLACLTFWLYWTLRIRLSGRQRVRIITVTGPSGAGKTTIVGELLKRHPGWGMVVSLTSRELRNNDLPGEYRCNLPVKYLQQLNKDGKALWLEGEHGNVYVTLFKDVNEARNSRTRTLSFMQILHRSVVKLRFYIPNEVLSVFILPPSEGELRRRLENRGESPEQIDRRIADCKKWEEEARVSGIPYEFVRNDGTVAEAVEKAEQIIDRYL